MSKYKAEKISYDKQNKLIEMFCEILKNLDSKEAIFNFLKDLLNRQERVMLSRRILIAKMLEDGKLIYGCEFEGKWLECGNKEAWLKSHLYFSLKDQKYGLELKKFIKDNRLI